MYYDNFSFYVLQYIIFIKENMMRQDSNEMFNYRIKFKFH